MSNNIMQEPKGCPRCKQTKPRSEFGKNVRLADGLDFYCRQCVREINRERRQKYRETVEPRTSGTKRCTRCKQVLDVGCYHVDRGRSDGLQPTCNDCFREWQKERSRRNKESYRTATGEKRCSKCKVVKPANDFTIDKSVEGGLRSSCKVCDTATHQKLRTEVLSHYVGGAPACACCRETTLEFLSIDHVNGGGRKHREELKQRSIYAWLKKEGYPEGYQVLCHNCNQAKGFYGECPHEQQRREQSEAAATESQELAPEVPVGWAGWTQEAWSTFLLGHQEAAK